MHSARLSLCTVYLKLRADEQQNNADYHDVNPLIAEIENLADDDEIESIPADVLSKCTKILTLLSIDGREDNIYLKSTPKNHADADRLIAKIREVHLELGGSTLDRKGFVRDVFSIGHQWTISERQYYSFIDYYDNPIVSNAVFKLIEWTVFPPDYQGGFAPAYHLERSYNKEYGFTYMLGRKFYPHYHESLVNFYEECPSYMGLKALIIGDLTGEAPLVFIVASGYRG
ncbi:unnamed protein product [Rotaria sp. Silwood1]|nr:unnamed protein product [Rotaria sp. Silwood1]